MKKFAFIFLFLASALIGLFPKLNFAQTVTTSNVYINSLASGWTNASYGSIINLNDTSSPGAYSPQAKIAWKPSSAYGALRFRHGGLETIGLSSISFALFATSLNQKVGVFINEGTAGYPKVGLEKYGGYPTLNSWKVYTIPLADLGGVNKNITTLTIQEWSGKSSGSPQMYVDEVVFKGSAVSPSPSPVLSPSPSIVPSPVASIEPTPIPTPVPSPSTVPSVEPSPSLMPTPVPSEVPSPTPSIVPSPSGQPSASYAYSDSLAVGWSNSSYGSSVNLNNTAPPSPYAGVSKISWDSTSAWGAFRISHAGFNISGLTHLSFAVNATVSNQRIGVFLNEGINGYSKRSLENYGGFPTLNGWKVYNIPVADLLGTSTNTNITTVTIQEWSGLQGGSPVIYIDEIKFLGSAASPSPTPSGGFSRPVLTLTFDDGSRSQYTNGWPIMQQYGLKGTFYITTGDLDGGYFMLPEEVVALKNGGNHIGAHTITHPNLTTLSLAEVERELSEPKTYLQNLLGVPINDFAVTYGKYNDSVLNQIKQYYSTNRITAWGYNSKNGFDKYLFKVQEIFTNTPASQIQSWVDTAKANNYWLILMYHSIESAPHAANAVTPETFDAHMSTIKNSAIPVVTFEQALSEVTPQL